MVTESHTEEDSVNWNTLKEKNEAFNLWPRNV